MAYRPRMLRQNWRCWEYDDTGRICGRPAVAIDPNSGYAVCARHAVEGLVHDLRTVSPAPDRYADATAFLAAASIPPEDADA